MSRATAPDQPTPATFDELVPYLGNTAQLIGANSNPVLVVNSDKDIEQEDLDFDQYALSGASLSVATSSHVASRSKV